MLKLEGLHLISNVSVLQTAVFSMNLDSDRRPLDPETIHEEKEDPWAIPELVDEGLRWKDLSRKKKIVRVLWSWISKPVLLLGCLYIFICSLSLLGSAFQLLGGKSAGEAFQSNQIITNPIAGVVLGILATVLVQSSSTTTSIVVAMVSSEILTVRTAIPIVMGANVGTSVTNTIVSLGNAKDRNEFRRAFAGATVHDMFNFLSLLVLLPLELASGCLLWLSGEIVSRCKSNSGSGGSNVDLLSAITKPFTEKIVILNSTLLQHIALDRNVTDSLIFSDCEHVSCDFLFHDTSLSDAAVGAIVLLMALIMLCACLVFIVKLLHSMLRGRLAFVIRKTVNSDLPKPFGCLTGYVAILIGAGVTMLVQSSSVFTSALTPLVGVGVVTVERMYPLTLGANIGTTITGILAALASTGNLCHALQIAVCHLIFNLSGILIWYPIPKLRQLPVFCSRLLGNTTAQYRWFPIFYVILVFFLMPAALFGLSLAGWYVLLAVGGPMALVATFIILINVLQSRLPQRLPGCLQNWDGLPLWMHSLDPLDHFLVWIGAKLMWLCCCRMCSGSAGKGTLSYDALTDNSDTDNPKGSSERKATYTTSL